MKVRLYIIINYLTLILVAATFTDHLYSQEIPWVYDTENRDAGIAKPVLPDFDQLQHIELLTDPFACSDGSGRSTRFEDWCRRRAEIGAEIQHYEIGPKPERPDSITAEYTNDTLTVRITVNGETLGKTSHVWFMEELFKFSNAVSKLPFDHHELMAMVAPRALLCLGNTDYEWRADESGYDVDYSRWTAWWGSNNP